MSSHAQPQLYLAGASHHTAPLAVREKLALPTGKLDDAYECLRRLDGVREACILNTCNRIEIYLVGNPANPREACLDFFAQMNGLPRHETDNYHHLLTGRDALRHLFETAAGLDSQMLGETEILGQVKDAYSRARSLGRAGPVLNRAFQKSFQAAKWARTHTGIGRGQISIGNVAAELALRICGDLETARILLVGTGEAGEKTAQSLKSRGARAVTVTGRRHERARALAEHFSGAVIDFPTFRNAIGEFDIIIGSTAASEPVLNKADIKAAMKPRPTEPLFLIDLAVPRDFDSRAARLQNVYLYNLDDLGQIANENLRAREAEVEECRRELAVRAHRLWEDITASHTRAPGDLIAREAITREVPSSSRPRNTQNA